MKKTTLLLSIIATTLLAEDVTLTPLTVTSTYEPTPFETQEIEYRPEITTTLPSNMLLSAQSSGIKIDGATSDFTSIYWNGIEVIDPAAPNNYPSLMNYGHSGSDVVSIDGSNVNYTTKEKNSIELEGGTPTFARMNAATTFKTDSTSHTLRLDTIYSKLHSSYTQKRGSYDSSEEKDKSKSYDLSYLGRYTFAENYSSSISILHKKVDYAYDGYDSNFQQDPNDKKASFDSTLSIVGIDAGYDKNNNELKIDLQATDSQRRSDNPPLNSQVKRFGLKGVYNLESIDLKLKASAHLVNEEAHVSSKDYERKYIEPKVALIYNSKYANINASAKKSYEDTYSSLVALDVPLYYGISYLAKYENNGVNPTIVQENAIYTIANNNLKSQKLKKYSGGIAFESPQKELLLRTTYSKISTDDMIAYVTIDPATYTAQYQNVDNTDYDFIYAELQYKAMDFTFTTNYSNISNVTSSKPSLNYNLPKHRAVSKLSYEATKLSAYVLVNYTSLQKTYGGNVEPSTIANMGVGYMLNNDLELRADVYNVTDKYYEYVASYPQNGRLITGTVKYTF